MLRLRTHVSIVDVESDNQEIAGGRYAVVTFVADRAVSPFMPTLLTLTRHRKSFPAPGDTVQFNTELPSPDG